MVVDFHSHVLPGIDDGSASVMESIRMLQLSARQGIKHVMATPHFYAHSDTPERFLKRRAASELQLREAMEKVSGLPVLTVGAEVRYFRGISRSDVIFQLVYQGTKTLLIEMPEGHWSEAMYKELDDIWSVHGIIPVIAHLDRYITPFRNHGIPKRLGEMPVLVQANASFFLRNSTSNMAIRMLKAGQIHLLGSDCHNMESRRPNLGPAVNHIEKRLGQDALGWIHNHEKIVLEHDV